MQTVRVLVCCMQHMKYGIPLPTLSHIDLHVWKCVGFSEIVATGLELNRIWSATK